MRLDFVFSSFRVASFRLFVFSHGVISRRKDEMAQTSHHIWTLVNNFLVKLFEEYILERQSAGLKVHA